MNETTLPSCNICAIAFKNSRISDLKMYDMYTPLSDTDYKFTYEESLAKAEEVLAVLGEDYLSRVKRAFSNWWLMCMSSKSARVPIQVVLMIPMPSCC